MVLPHDSQAAVGSEGELRAGPLGARWTVRNEAGSVRAAVAVEAAEDDVVEDQLRAPHFDAGEGEVAALRVDRHPRLLAFHEGFVQGRIRTERLAAGSEAPEEDRRPLVGALRLAPGDHEDAIRADRDVHAVLAGGAFRDLEGGPARPASGTESAGEGLGLHAVGRMFEPDDHERAVRCHRDRRERLAVHLVLRHRELGSARPAQGIEEADFDVAPVERRDRSDPGHGEPAVRGGGGAGIDLLQPLGVGADAEVAAHGKLRPQGWSCGREAEKHGQDEGPRTKPLHDPILRKKNEAPCPY